MQRKGNFSGNGQMILLKLSNADRTIDFHHGEKWKFAADVVIDANTIGILMCHILPHNTKELF